MRIRGRTSSDFIIRFSGSAEMAWRGKVEHVQSGQVQYFRSCLELWRLIQQKLDEIGHPQATMKMRTWSDNSGENYVEGGGYETARR